MNACKREKTATQEPKTQEHKPTSLKVLSDHLGLSMAAISRVLSGAPAARSIPKATQDRILKAAEDLNYRPNLFARSLRNRRSQTVGVIVPEVSEGYATLVLSGIEHELMQADYFYFLISHHHREEMIQRSERLFRDRAVEGVIAVDTLLRDRWAIPTVTVSGHHEPKGVTNIVLNHRLAAELAIDHLSGLGHKRLAFIKGQKFSSDTESRWRGIRHAMEKRGLTIFPQLVMQLEGDQPTHEPGYLATQKLLACGETFTALFAFNDVSAIGAIKALREAGLRVPQDVSVVGFDDVQSAAFQNPALTTVRQPLRTMGTLAAQTVLLQIAAAAGGNHAQEIVVDPELVVRESTCPPGTGK
ncbi:LacI family DNA-binding transcriptional regulator [Tunturiibacter gelidiferens]